MTNRQNRFFLEEHYEIDPNHAPGLISFPCIYPAVHQQVAEPIWDSDVFFVVSENAEAFQQLLVGVADVIDGIGRLELR